MTKTAKKKWDGDGPKVEAVKSEARGNHDVLHPPQTLRKKAYVTMRSGDPTPDQVVGEGEKALAEVAVNFPNWMSSEIDGLADAHAKHRHSGPGQEDEENLFQAAHTVRGNAGVFGFPLAGQVADSLAKLLARCPAEKWPSQLIGQHVDAIRAMLREDARGVSNPQARALARALIDVTAEFLDKAAPEPDAA